MLHLTGCKDNNFRLLLIALSIFSLAAALYDKQMHLLSGGDKKLDAPADQGIKMRLKRDQARRTRLPGEIVTCTVSVVNSSGKDKGRDVDQDSNNDKINVNSSGGDTDMDVYQDSNMDETSISDMAPFTIAYEALTKGVSKSFISAPNASDHKMIKTKGTEELNITSSMIKLGFDKVYCIDFVIRYKENGDVGHFWKCTNNSCACSGKNCSELVLIVSVEATTEGEISSPPLATSNCKFGNFVTVQSNGSQFHEDEFAVLETKVDCPVGTSSALAFSCLFGIFLSVSIILKIILTRRWLRKCCSKGCSASKVESDHEYVNNNFPLPTLPLSPAPPPPVRISSPSSLVSDQSHSQEDNSVAEAETADADYVNGMEMGDGFYMNGNK